MPRQVALARPVFARGRTLVPMTQGAALGASYASATKPLLFVLVVGLVLIWAPQLRTLALSLTAVAVAIVVATKELILCISGSVMRASSRAFSVGDWIEVAGLRGEVTDHSLFVTTLQELGGGGQGWHYTGRTVVVPNSVFLSAPIRNHNLLRSFTFHTFALTVEPHLNLFRHEAHMRSVVERHVAPFRDEARRAEAAARQARGAADPRGGAPGAPPRRWPGRRGCAGAAAAQGGGRAGRHRCAARGSAAG